MDYLHGFIKLKLLLILDKIISRSQEERHLLLSTHNIQIKYYAMWIVLKSVYLFSQRLFYLLDYLLESYLIAQGFFFLQKGGSL